MVPRPGLGTCTGFHSISFPSEWGVLGVTATMNDEPISFHSISFPSEWGGQKDRHKDYDRSL